MISSEVERTLVKSPPELWTEISNPDALARHLGEFGQIRITRVEPELAVEWEADNTAGTVRIKPSGWGTKVTITATREVAVPEQDVEDIPAAAAPDEDVAVSAASFEAAPEPDAEIDNAAEVLAEPPASASLANAQEPESEQRVGFFRRLFSARRKKTREQTPLPADALTALSDALAPDTIKAVDPFSAPRSSPIEATREPFPPAIEPPPDISAELAAAEEAATDEVTAVLTSVLDRLGAAHHRPFSRA